MSTLALSPHTGERLSPLDRLLALCDPGSLQLIRGEVLSRRMGERTSPGDGVIGATGRVDGRSIACYAQDPSYVGGSLGEVHAETICRVLRTAGRARIPVVSFIESAGARLQEGVAALAGYARIFNENVALSGQVPQISVICGAVGGRRLLLPRADGLRRHDQAGVDVPHRTRRRQRGHGRGNRRRHARRPEGARAKRRLPARGRGRSRRRMARSRPARLPAQHAGEPARRWPTMDPFEGPSDTAVPDSKRHVYDVRDVVRTLVDGGRLLEISPRWARNMLTGFARLDGRVVGIVANQPKYLGGVLDADAATKGARFVRTCDLYGIPLVVLVDTPGFLPGCKQEKAGVIRHGAKLVHAFAAATVPRLTVVLRKAYGGAMIAMNSRELGADLVLAWPQAQLGVMGGPQAVDLVHRRAIAAADDPADERTRLAEDYERDQLTAATAAGEGVVDEIVPPTATRQRLAPALQTLDNTERLPSLNRNIPL